MNILKNKILLGFIILLVFVQVGLLIYAFIRPRSYLISNSIEAKTEVAKIYDNGLADSVDYGGILPHNPAVRKSIEQYLKSFESQNIENIILLAPNHLAYGSNLISTVDASFKLNGQSMNVDDDISQKLAGSGYARIDNKSVADELAIGVLAPILQRHFPRAKLNFLIFKDSPNDSASLEIAKVLGRLKSDKKLLVFGTVDFSHYQTRAVADFHDEQSQAAIENFNYEKLGKLEIDSPFVLSTALRYFSEIGAGAPRLIEHTNTASLPTDSGTPSTSHFFYSFEKGMRPKYQQASVLFFGDLMLDRGVKQLIERKGADYLFARLKGEENRFFMGTDYIGANLEGVVTANGAHLSPVYANDFAFDPSIIKSLSSYNFNIFNLANNHVLDQGAKAEVASREYLKTANLEYFGCHDKQVGDCTGIMTHTGSTSIAWLGFSQVYGKLDQAKVVAKIIEVKQQTDFVIVNVHWGQEYQSQFNASQQTLAHAMVEAGADVIIGHHPHVVQGIEQYKTSLIFYSLGNFIFDQYFSVKTQQGLGVGLNLDSRKIQVHIFPLDLAKSQPQLMTGNRKKVFLDNLANLSAKNSDLKLQITQGFITVEK